MLLLSSGGRDLFGFKNLTGLKKQPKVYFVNDHSSVAC
jgi:hypothetical protein